MCLLSTWGISHEYYSAFFVIIGPSLGFRWLPDGFPSGSQKNTSTSKSLKRRVVVAHSHGNITLFDCEQVSSRWLSSGDITLILLSSNEPDAPDDDSSGYGCTRYTDITGSSHFPALNTRSRITPRNAGSEKVNQMAMIEQRLSEFIPPAYMPKLMTLLKHMLKVSLTPTTLLRPCLSSEPTLANR